MVREIVKKKTKRFERCGGAETSLQQQHHNHPEQLEKCEVVCRREREREREREKGGEGKRRKGPTPFHSSCCRRLMLLLLLTHSP
jgi:hypothetical protein